MKITYSLQEYEMSNLGKKIIKGWVSNSLNVSKSKKDIMIMNYEELTNHFTPEDLEKLFSRTHEKYILVEKCRELNMLFAELSKITHNEFKQGKTVEICIEGLCFKFDLKKTDRYEISTVINGEKIFSDWGNKSSSVSINVMIDKLKRHFGYKDPYKHHIEDILLAELIVS